MKKFFFGFTLIFLTTSFSVQANDLNLKAGTLMLGGEISYQNIRTIPDNDEEDSLSSSLITVSPVGGFFVSDNLAVIGSLGFKQLSGDSTEPEEREFTLTAGARFYQHIFGFYIYLGMGAGYNYVKYSDNYNLGLDSLNSFAMVASGGVLYPLNQFVAIETGVKMQYLLNSDNVDDRVTLSFGYFGISAFF
ncbi:MAG: hypothetical protein ACQES9_11015 [Myxococcota bacterium]